MALKILVKNPKKWGLNSLHKNIAVGLKIQPGRLAVDRPVDRQRSKNRPLEEAGRPPKNREQSSLARSTGPSAWPTCTGLCTSVDRLGRPTLRPVDRPVDRQSLAGWVLGQKTELKIILKIPINLLKIHKNSFIILH